MAENSKTEEDVDDKRIKLDSLDDDELGGGHTIDGLDSYVDDDSEEDPKANLGGHKEIFKTSDNVKMPSQGFYNM